MFRLTRTTKRVALVAGSLGVAALMTIFTLVVPATAAPIAAASSIPKCTAGDLGVWLAIDQSDGAAGTIYTPLEFTNLSHHTCRLHGFPGVSAINSDGQQIGVPAGWDHAVKATTVRLAPGGTAHAILEYHDVIIASCPKADRRTAFELRVIPPDQYRSDHVLWPMQACASRSATLGFLDVRVIAPGPGVRGDIG